MRHATRRTFLASAAAVTLLPHLKVRGANDDIRVAILGVRGMGNHHIKQFGAVEGVRVVSLCDPDRQILASRCEEAGISSDRAHTDMRRIFDDKEIDAVVVATPNHWHALATIWACEAGKDVYVEKPASYDIWEGRQMVAAARKHNRIVQVGTQRRSDDNLREAFEQIRGGEFGRILRTRVLHFRFRNGIGRAPEPKAPPASVDYNLWAGPAAMSPIIRPSFHYDWHWFWEWGNGELGNNGPHAMDLARWVNGYGHVAPRVLSIGGRYVWDDAGETPNTHIVYYDYEPAPIICEIRNLPAEAGTRTHPAYRGHREGLLVECEHAYFAGFSGGAFFDNEGNRIRQVGGDGGRHHPRTFIRAVRSRKVADLTCDIVEGHLSAALCHQGNISHRLGKERAYSSVREAVGGNPILADAVDRMAEHLEANEVSIKDAGASLGPMLEMDTAAERFTGPLAEQANALLRRERYREPFVVPELA